MRPFALRRAFAFVAFTIACTLLATTSFAVRADELQDVSRLVSRGRLDEAERRADAFLAQRPKDAQMRFLKGTILAQRGKRDEAAAIFTALTQEFPELPEPYNNLAAIDASRGEYDNARAALETSVRVQPGYATAYENLGDIYTALAAKAYQDARRLDPKNATAGRKLDVSRALLAGAPAPAVASAGAPATSLPARSATPTQASVGLPRPAGAPAATVGFGAVSPDVVVPASTPVLAPGSNIVGIESDARPADALDDTSTMPVVPASASQAMADVSAAIQRWASDRRVRVSDLRIRIDGETATARVKEEGGRGAKGGGVEKELSLARRRGAWVVTGERNGS